MYTDLDKKIDNLLSRDKYKFYVKLDSILGENYHSAVHKIMGGKYESLSIKKIEEAKEKLYKEMFENNNDNKKDN